MLQSRLRALFFCSKIRGEEHKTLSENAIQVARASGESASSAGAESGATALLAASPLAPRISCSFSFLCSSPRIFERNRDCEQSLHYIISTFVDGFRNGKPEILSNRHKLHGIIFLPSLNPPIS